MIDFNALQCSSLIFGCEECKRQGGNFCIWCGSPLRDSYWYRKKLYDEKIAKRRRVPQDCASSSKASSAFKVGSSDIGFTKGLAVETSTIGNREVTASLGVPDIFNRCAH